MTSLVAALVLGLYKSSTQEKNEEEKASDSSNNGNDDSIVVPVSTETLTIIFRLAQICHCHAQGKVGSGFDVAAACYGSHIYQRIPKDILATILSQLDDNNNDNDNNNNHKDNDDKMAETRNQLLLLRQLGKNIRSQVLGDNNNNIDNNNNNTIPTWTGGVVAPIQIPSFLQVLLADVSGGSESPSMARTVLQWKTNQIMAAADTSGIGGEGRYNKAMIHHIPHWSDLAKLNTQVGELWQQLTALPEPSQSQINALARTHASEWPSTMTTTTTIIDDENDDQQTKEENERCTILFHLYQCLKETRSSLKALGDAAQVPIEPTEQTELANATMALPGVLTALVPGAGGYDALACVYIHTDSVQTAIDELWSNWTWSSSSSSSSSATTTTTETTNTTKRPFLLCPLTVQAISYGEGLQIVHHHPEPQPSQK